ncbi:hypothetical protein PG993_013443 [Apiospora rasikravindrae]|uniref:Uncharacterized protein n=1 Tax=Apiospora rasikravindrae TaxID=990691 RepID=A0ABR1RXN4_9PEZI
MRRPPLLIRVVRINSPLSLRPSRMLLLLTPTCPPSFWEWLSREKALEFAADADKTPDAAPLAALPWAAARFATTAAEKKDDGLTGGYPQGYRWFHPSLASVV